MVEDLGSGERRKLLASHTQSCIYGKVVVRRFETHSQSFGSLAAQLPAGEATIAKTWTALSGRAGDRAHMPARPTRTSQDRTLSSIPEPKQVVSAASKLPPKTRLNGAAEQQTSCHAAAVPKMTIRSTQAPLRTASFVNEFPFKTGRSVNSQGLPPASDVAPAISQTSAERLLGLRAEFPPHPPADKGMPGPTARRTSEFSLEHAVSVKTGFPGTPWVCFQLLKQLKHSSVSSFPSNCFIIGRARSKNPADKKSGSAIACCITITRWKPVLQVQFPPPLSSSSGSEVLSSTAKAAAAPISFVVEQLQQLSTQGQSLVMQASQSLTPGRQKPVEDIKSRYPLKKLSERKQLVVAMEALLQGRTGDGSLAQDFGEFLNQRLMLLKDAGVQSWKNRETLAGSVIPAARMWGHQFLLTIHQDISEHFEGTTRGLSPDVEAFLQAPLVVAELLPLVLKRLQSKLGPLIPGLGRLARPNLELPRMRASTITYRGKNGAIMTREETAPVSAWPSFVLPVQGGWLSSNYGWRDGRFHQGIDIAVEENTDVKAAADGVVTYVGWRGGYGKVVHLDHGNGCMTLYAHCNSFLVRKGQTVQGMQRIALSGNTGKSTGPHLHFEVQRNGGTVDPMEYLQITTRSRFVLA